MAPVKGGFDKNNIANVYLFYGEETYKCRNYKDMLRKLIADRGSINYAAFEGRDIDFSAVYDSVITLPFFAEKRLVIVENSGKFRASKKAASEEELPEGKSDRADSMLEKILADLPATTCLVFFEAEVNKTKKIYKTIAARGQVIECAPDDKETVIRWLARGFAGDKKNMRRSSPMQATGKRSLMTMCLL